MADGRMTIRPSPRLLVFGGGVCGKTSHAGDPRLRTEGPGGSLNGRWQVRCNKLSVLARPGRENCRPAAQGFCGVQEADRYTRSTNHNRHDHHGALSIDPSFPSSRRNWNEIRTYACAAHEASAKSHAPDPPSAHPVTSS